MKQNKRAIYLQVWHLAGFSSCPCHWFSFAFYAVLVFGWRSLMGFLTIFCFAFCRCSNCSFCSEMVLAEREWNIRPYHWKCRWDLRQSLHKRTHTQNKVDFLCTITEFRNRRCRTAARDKKISVRRCIWQLSFFSHCYIWFRNTNRVGNLFIIICVIHANAKCYRNIQIHRIEPHLEMSLVCACTHERAGAHSKNGWIIIELLSKMIVWCQKQALAKQFAAGKTEK